MAVLAAIYLNGSRPVVNYKRRTGEEAGLVAIAFIPLLVMNCVNRRHASNSLPLAVAVGFAAAVPTTIHSNESRPVVNGERKGR